MGRSYKHATVIGASLGGLCAARVLSDVCERVTVYERDALPDGPANRAAVPQGKHVHLLMARGAQEFESHFPGLLDDMVADGVPMLENRPDCIHFGAAGHVLGTAHRLQDEFTAYVPSRPMLEWQIRRRVLAIENVDLVNQAMGNNDYRRNIAPQVEQSVKFHGPFSFAKRSPGKQRQAQGNGGGIQHEQLVLEPEWFLARSQHRLAAESFQCDPKQFLEQFSGPMHIRIGQVGFAWR